MLTLKQMYAWVLGLLGLTPGVRAAPATPEAFSSAFVAALQRSAPTLDVDASVRMELRVKTARGERSTVFLGNAYSEYLSNPSATAMGEIIQRYVASFGSIGKEHVLEPSNIVPVIKDRGWLEDMRDAMTRTEGEGATQVFEDFNGKLVIVYAEDTPANTRYFSDAELTKIGLKRDNLRTLAIANLERILPEIQHDKGPKVSMLTAGADYVASLLLLDGLWTKVRSQVDGEIVVAVPSRDVLLFTGSNDAEGVEALQAMATEAVHSNRYRLTDTLFVYRGGKFEVFRP